MNRSAPIASNEKVRRWLSRRRSTWMVTAFALVVVVGFSVGLVVPSSSAPKASVSRDTTSSGASGSNARSAPAAGGAAGAINDLAATGLTLTTSAGQTVSVTYSSATTFDERTASTLKSSLKVGDDVLVVGTTSSTSIVASQVVVESSRSSMFLTSSAVIPFTRSAPTNLKEIGDIPTGWTQGSGTIVGGTSATKATEAALAKYPGGIVDRVVKLNNGQYNVHYIGVNWPHHIFVSQTFEVVGAE
jgi:hypothetical protein